MLNKGILLGSTALLVALAACTPTPVPGGIQSVNLAEPAGTLAVGQSISLAVTVTPAQGSTASTDFTCTVDAASDVFVNVSKGTNPNVCTVVGVAPGAATVTARSTADTTKFNTSVVNVVAAPDPMTPVVRMDVGNNGEDTKPAIPTGWVPDTLANFQCNDAATINHFYPPNNFAAITIPAATAAKAAPDTVYQTERFCPGDLDKLSFIQNTDLTAGNDYLVRLHFAELFNDQANERVMTVTINGTLQTTPADVDIVRDAGGQNTALVVDYTVNDLVGTSIKVDLKATVATPSLEGIEIYQVNQ